MQYSVENWPIIASYKLSGIWDSRPAGDVLDYLMELFVLYFGCKGASVFAIRCSYVDLICVFLNRFIISCSVYYTVYKNIANNRNRQVRVSGQIMVTVFFYHNFAMRELFYPFCPCHHLQLIEKYNRSHIESNSHQKKVWFIVQNSIAVHWRKCVINRCRERFIYTTEKSGVLTENVMIILKYRASKRSIHSNIKTNSILLNLVNENWLCHTCVRLRQDMRFVEHLTKYFVLEVMSTDAISSLIFFKSENCFPVKKYKSREVIAYAVYGTHQSSVSPPCLQYVYPHMFSFYTFIFYEFQNLYSSNSGQFQLNMDKMLATESFFKIFAKKKSGQVGTLCCTLGGEVNLGLGITYEELCINFSNILTPPKKFYRHFKKKFLGKLKISFVYK
ncbi:hypothetical protein AGLY_008813 [Aphis glycines]|uniref:Uncharacterized protein n=1 Tax=Aphis glycines TaxID=307491 RepID=A0A6G0TLW1_APHGL|nr:hypothetical protein AGLY_008813 [Aphis glycines]